MNNGKPNYTHDCKQCLFLGEIVAGGKLCDLYFCPQGGLTTVIARYSSEGADYASGMPAVGLYSGSAELIVARLRAEALGYRLFIPQNENRARNPKSTSAARNVNSQ